MLGNGELRKGLNGKHNGIFGMVFCCGRLSMPPFEVGDHGREGAAWKMLLDFLYQLHD